MAKLAEIRVTAELIASARRGDDSARAHLYTELAPATFGLIRRLVGAHAVAEDLFQDTMISVYEHLDAFRGSAPLGAWVRQIAVSKCLMYLRSPWHRARLDAGAWIDEVWDADRSESVATDRQQSAVATAYWLGPSAESLDLERALASLSPTARAVIWLFEVEGYSHQEIARAFNRSVSFSKSQLARAHRRLREWLEPQREREPCVPL